MQWPGKPVSGQAQGNLHKTAWPVDVCVATRGSDHAASTLLSLQARAGLLQVRTLDRQIMHSRARVEPQAWGHNVAQN